MSTHAAPKSRAWPVVTCRFRQNSDGLVMTASAKRGSRRTPTATIKTPGEIARNARLIAGAIGTPGHADRIANEMRSAWTLKHQSIQPAAPADTPDLDTGELIHAEFFHIPNVATGLTIPVTTVTPTGNAGRWRLYLHRYDDFDHPRHSTPLPASITADGGRRHFYIEPQPTPPAPNTDPGWSQASRAAYLDGAAATAATFNELATFIGRMVDLTNPGGPAADKWAMLLAAWTALTYCYHVCDTVPYLLIGGAPGSGKTRLLELIATLCFRPLATSNITGPALFRTINDRGGTLLLDEAEKLGDGGDQAELRNVLLAGYKRFGKCTRLDDGGPTDFHVFGPKAIAAINTPGPVLASRCVQVTMLRRPAGIGPLPSMRAAADELSTLRDSLHIHTLDHMAAAVHHAMRDLDKPVCSFDGRAYEVWAPLLAVARWADGDADGPAQAAIREIAFWTMSNLADERLPEGDLAALAAARHLIAAGREPSAGEILAAAAGSPDYADAVQHWTPRRIAEALRRYGLETERSNGRRRYRRYRSDTFDAIESRFAISIPPLFGGGTTQRTY